MTQELVLVSSSLVYLLSVWYFISVTLSIRSQAVLASLDMHA